MHSANSAILLEGNIMGNAQLRLVTPTTENRTVTPRRAKNSELRTREHLAADAAGLEIKVHPHMLRHACGFALANKGHDTRSLQAYLGHRGATPNVRLGKQARTRYVAGILRANKQDA